MTQSYDLFVQSRVKPGEDILATMTPFRARLLHAAIGLSGEAGELLEGCLTHERDAIDRDNIIEEMGDIHFYLSDLNALLEIHDFAEISIAHAVSYVASLTGLTLDTDRLMSPAIHISVEAGNLLDAIKKHVIYNKALDMDAVKLSYLRIMGALGFLSAGVDTDRNEVKQANQAKLEKRYPTGYTDADAAARADKEQGQ